MSSRHIVRTSDGWRIEERGQRRRRSSHVWTTHAEAAAVLETYQFDAVAAVDFPRWGKQVRLNQHDPNLPRCAFCGDWAKWRGVVILDEHGRWGTLHVCSTYRHNRTQLQKFAPHLIIPVIL